LAVLIGCAAFLWVQARHEQRILGTRWLRTRNRRDVVQAPLLVGSEYHLFLSHAWKGGGQDVMRVVKTRLKEMVPGMKVFLDVDDLHEGRGVHDVDKSESLLAFVTPSYLRSANSMKELIRAMTQAYRIITLLDGEYPNDRTLDRNWVKGELTKLQEEGGEWFTKWRMRTTMEEWLDEYKENAPYRTSPERDSRGSQSKNFHCAPSSNGIIMCEKIAKYMDVTDDIMYELYDDPTGVIQWSRLGPFQDISMRLIASWVLTTSREPSTARITLREEGDFYLQGELTLEHLDKRVLARANACKIYCNDNNKGLKEELANDPDLKIPLNFETDKLRRDDCHCMVLHLTGKTWAPPKQQQKDLLDDIIHFSERLLLAHELPGLGQEERHAVPFDFLLNRGEAMPKAEYCGTPEDLIPNPEKTVYKNIAISFMGGEWRKTSWAQLVKKVADMRGTRSKLDACCIASGITRVVPECRRLWCQVSGDDAAQRQKQRKVQLRDKESHDKNCPTNWLEMHHSETNQKYYLNTVTGEVADRPPNPVAIKRRSSLMHALRRPLGSAPQANMLARSHGDRQLPAEVAMT